MPRITLLEMLSGAGVIDRRQFDEALQNRVLYGGKIGTSLIELGFVREDDLAKFLGRKLEVPFVPADFLLNIPQEVIALLPPELARKYHAVPLKLSGRRLALAMADPADLKAVDEISFATGYIIRPVVAPEVRLVQALGKYYQEEIDPRYLKIIERMEKERAKPVPKRKAGPPPAPAGERRAKPVEEPDELLQEAEIVGEAWKERVREHSVDAVSRTLAKAENRDEIGKALTGFLDRNFGRSAIFLVRGGEAIGWRGTASGEAIPSFSHFHLPLDEPSILKNVAEEMKMHLGSFPEAHGNIRIAAALRGGWPVRALLMPLVVLGRTVLVVYVHGEPAMEEKIPELQRFLAKAALAFEILICRERILML
jgi:hypothetical protein